MQHLSCCKAASPPFRSSSVPPPLVGDRRSYNAALAGAASQMRRDAVMSPVLRCSHCRWPCSTDDARWCCYAVLDPSSLVAGAAMQPSSSVAGCCDATGRCRGCYHTTAAAVVVAAGRATCIAMVVFGRQRRCKKVVPRIALQHDGCCSRCRRRCARLGQAWWFSSSAAALLGGDGDVRYKQTGEGHGGLLCVIFAFGRRNQRCVDPI